MELDFSPLEPFVDELLVNLLIVIGMPLIAALIIKYLLVKVKVPDYFAGVLSSFAFLYVAYKVFMAIVA